MDNHQILAFSDGDNGHKKAVFDLGDGKGFGIIACNPNGTAVPCQCDGDPPGCDNGCGGGCNRPGCFLTNLGEIMPDCLQVNFDEFLHIDECRDPAGNLELVIHSVSGLSGSFRVPRVNTSLNVYRETFPCLVTYTTYSNSGTQSTFHVDREVTVEVFAFVCNSSSGEQCLYAASASSDHPLGFTVSTNNPRPIGFLYNNQGRNLGCESTESPIVGTTMDVSLPPSCEALQRTYLARSCDGTRNIVVDLETYPPDESLYLAKLDDVLYEVTGTWVNTPTTPGYVWVQEECPVLDMVVARLCSDPSVEISIDPTTLDPDCPTVFLGPDQYSVTTETTDDPPVAVVCSPDPCPGERFVAYPCSTLPNSPNFPDQVLFVYTLAPGMLPGEGVIRATWTDGTVGQGQWCTFTFFLRPTIQSTDQFSFFNEVQLVGQCAGTRGGSGGPGCRNPSPPIEPGLPFVQAPPTDPNMQAMINRQESEFRCTGCGG